MAKDRSPEEILKDNRTLFQKVKDELDEIGVSEKELRKFIKASQTKSKGNPKEAGASIEVTKNKSMERKTPRMILERAKDGGLMEATAKLKAKGLKEGGLAEATAKLKAKGFSEGGAVVKDKIVSIDTSPNSGLITTKGFGASRRT